MYLNITRDVDLGVVRKLECLDPGVKNQVCTLLRQLRVTLLPVSNQFWHSKHILKINFITSIKWFRNFGFSTHVTRTRNNGFTGHRFVGIKYRYFVSAAEQISTNDLQTAACLTRELEFVSCECEEIFRVIGPAVPGHHICWPPVSVLVFDVNHDAQVLSNPCHSCHRPNL